MTHFTEDDRPREKLLKSGDYRDARAMSRSKDPNIQSMGIALSLLLIGVYEATGKTEIILPPVEQDEKIKERSRSITQYLK